MLSHYLLLLLFLAGSMFLSVWRGKLTIAAAVAGGVLGFFIFEGAGVVGIALLTAFFILGTAATAWKLDVKEKRTIAERDKGRRKASQVFANAGVAGILGALIILIPDEKNLFQLMMAGSFSAATADTLSSELGNIYGRKFYNIITLKKDERGLNGVISAEGTLFGVAGSILIAIIYSVGFGWGISFLWIVLAGTVGNLWDSFLGATLERKRVLNNDAVNFFNTAVGALAVFLFISISN